MKLFVVFTIVLVAMVVGGESLLCYNCDGDECKTIGDHQLRACANTGLTMACFSLNKGKFLRYINLEKNIRKYVSR